MRKTGGGSGAGGSEGSSSSEERVSSGKRRSFPRFSLRRLLNPSPLLARRFLSAVTGGGTAATVGGTQVCQPQQSQLQQTSLLVNSAATSHFSTNGESSPGESRANHLDQQNSRLTEEQTITDSKLNANNSSSDPNKSDGSERIECSLCLNELAPEYFPQLVTCPHRSCYDCFQVYLRVEISESRVSVTCPQCAEAMHPNDIRMILNDKTQYDKYEDFMVRRVLAVDPDTRWCPAPDCSYAVVASGCASCPKIKCEREGCGSYFCYHCKAAWHPNQTCDAARAQRSPNVRSSSLSFSQDSHHRDDIKSCPRCQVLIVKMDDGSCNHMTCAVCGAEFCWLCMKEISDLHYLSPSGCTFWGKKPWSRKKKILWQLGTLVGAPVGIGLVAGIAVPAIIIGIPVWVGRKIYTRYEKFNKHKRNLAIAGGVTASVLISPILAGLAVGIGVPILLFYVYGVVPVSLCRSGGCGVSTSGAGVRFEFDDEQDVMGVHASKTNDGDTVSHPGGNPSIGEVSLSLGSGSQLEREADRESASFVALAGSIASNTNTGQRLEVLADVVACQRFSVSSETASAATSLSDKTDAASTMGLAGSPLNNFKTEGGSLSNYRGTSNDSSGSTADATVYSLAGSVVPEPEPATVDSLEELSTGLLRKVTKKNKLSHKDDVEDGCLDRVRFDDNVSFMGLAGSPHNNFKTEGGSLSNYRGASNDSSGSTADATLYRLAGSAAPEPEPATVNSLEELATGLLRKVTKKNKLSHKDDVEDGCLDRVRFDDNVSFMGLAGSQHNNFKTEGGSLSNYRGASNDSAGSTTDIAGYRLAGSAVPEPEPATVNTLDELASGLLRKVTKKNKLNHKDDIEEGCLDRVRFDDNVSFMGLAGSPLNSFKTEGVLNYRGTSSDSVADATIYRLAGSAVSEPEPATVNSLEELTTGLVRKVTKKNKLVRSTQDNVNFNNPQLEHHGSASDLVKSETIVESINETRHRNEAKSSTCNLIEKTQTEDINSNKRSSTPINFKVDPESSPLTNHKINSISSQYWDDNSTSYYGKRLSGSRKNNFGSHRDEIEDISSSERVRFDKNVSYIDRQTSARKLEEGSLTSKPTLRSLFFQQIAEPTQPRAANSLDNPTLLPTIPEPMDSVTVSVSD